MVIYTSARTAKMERKERKENERCENKKIHTDALKIGTDSDGTK